MKKRITVLVLIFTLLIGTMSLEAGFAASATVSLSGGGTYEKGNSVSVTLTYSGDTYGAATASFTYDPSVLEYKSCSGAEAYGSGGTVVITMSNGSGTSSLSCTLTFTAVGVGTCSVTATTSDVYNLDMQELSASSKSVSVTVRNTQSSASTNANLSSLQVSGGSLSPSFSSSTTSYTVNVSNDVTVCTISAKTADSKATYKVTGSKNLSVGNNVRTVVVTAESGATKTYTITIVRAAASGSSDSSSSGNKSDDGNSSSGDEEENMSEEDEDGGDDAADEAIYVTVKDVEYLIVDDYTDVEIPEGFSQCIKSYDDMEILAIENAEGDVTLCLLEDTESGERAWFFYNDEKESFSATQRFTVDQILAYTAENQEDEPEETEEEEEEETADEDDAGSVNFMLLCVAATAIILVIVLMIILLLNRRKQKRAQ